MNSTEPTYGRCCRHSGHCPPHQVAGSSSGSQRRQGAITKAGNRSARRALVEATWAYRYPARLSPAIARRQTAAPWAALDIAWRALVRLCGRFRRLAAREVNRNNIAVAIARKLASFVWAIAQRVKPV